MPSVRIRENEYFDAALRRFKRACEKAGILTELRRREFYEKPTQERKRKKAAAIKRHMKRISREGMRHQEPRAVDHRRARHVEIPAEPNSVGLLVIDELKDRALHGHDRPILRLPA